MDNVTQWLGPQDLHLDLDARNGQEVLRAVSATIARSHGLDAELVCRALLRREAAGSTGVGNGFAIPHARIAGIAEPATVYVRTRFAVDIGAPDGKPASEFFVILVPADGDNSRHLQLLAQVAEIFSDNAFRARLVAATEPLEIRTVFAQRLRAAQTGEAAVSPPSSHATSAEDAPTRRVRPPTRTRQGVLSERPRA